MSSSPLLFNRQASELSADSTGHADDIYHVPSLSRAASVGSDDWELGDIEMKSRYGGLGKSDYKLTTVGCILVQIFSGSSTTLRIA